MRIDDHQERGVLFTKIISGGQTGVDRAALDVALELGLPCGGWCPRGRRADEGPIPLGILFRKPPPTPIPSGPGVTSKIRTEL
jgi:hypothetical protein